MLSIVIAVLLLINTLVLLFMARNLLDMRRIFTEFISSPAENEPSPFATLVSSISDVFSRSVVASAKSVFMAKQGADNRAERAVEADIAEDMLSAKSPMLSALLDSFPTLKKSIRRNPGLIDMAAQKLLSKTQNTPAGSNGNQEQVKFKF